MNKKVIWAIVSLMSLAIIGVVWLQTDMTITAVQANEQQFDENVFEALNEVTDQLEREENETFINATTSGFMTTFYQKEQIGGTSSVSPSILDFMMKAKESGLPIEFVQMASAFTQACYCPKCLEDPTNPLRNLEAYAKNAPKISLEERIDPEKLNTIIKRKLKDRGIKTPFTYGVYSTEEEAFVILNDHYVVKSSNPQTSMPGYSNILTTPYEVSLFEDKLSVPGKLKLHFPDKSSFVRASVWPYFVGSLLLSLIIVFSFAYTVFVIFRQKKVSEMKTDFINNMTHEFKTPIATISLAADSITSPMISGSPSKVQRFASIIKQENKRMNKQVEKVLQMARLERSEFSLKITDVNLHEVIRSAIENINLQVEKKEGSATAIFNAKKPVIQGDLTHISNVVNNLLDNANKYSPEKPEIVVHTNNADKGVQVIVEDKGLGMSAETKKHIFDKFYRIHTGNLHDIKGFGLGLSYVKTMMQAHRGNVSVKSEPGKGSSFTLFFPFKQKS